MENQKTKKPAWYAILFLAVLMLLLAGAGFAMPKGEKTAFETTAELDGKRLGGIAGKMTEANLKLLFETILGIHLSGYEGYATFDAALYALRDGRVDALWCPDVTAAYLTAQYGDLYEIAQEKEETERLSFAMAFRTGDETRCHTVSEAIAALQKDGTLTGLAKAYVETGTPLTMSESDMTKQKGDTLYIGVTGTIPPIDRFDENGRPCGFSVALLEEIGKYTGYRFVLVPVENETAFTLLESGKIDAVFGYGTSKNTTPGKRAVITTAGYYTMQHYSYVAVKEE